MIFGNYVKNYNFYLKYIYIFFKLTIEYVFYLRFLNVNFKKIIKITTELYKSCGIIERQNDDGFPFG